MTPQQIRDAIAADPALQAMRDAGNHQGIADALSVGRTKLAPYEAGKGDVIQVLGFESGNNLCDAIDGNLTFRHVRHLLEAGKLRLDLSVTQMAMAGVVQAGVITQAESDALLALARVPDPIGHEAVTAAIRGS